MDAAINPNPKESTMETTKIEATPYQRLIEDYRAGKLSEYLLRRLVGALSQAEIAEAGGE